ncbi:MAG: hypothetical protein KBF21_01035 [Thermoanaerobaculia bacterium]|nr:hypothetical protein [Thermoanaerobaculia bacterium]MBP9822783.1 hypothetical protein [Thermoanaerobaculia bacterium]
MSAPVHRLETPLALLRSDVLHFLGYPRGREPQARVAAKLEECLARARSLVRGRGVWTTLAVEQAPEVGLAPVPASGLVIGLVTAGAAIVEAASDRMAVGDATAALIFDACGSAAAEEAADRMSAAIIARLGGLSGGTGAMEDRAEGASESARVAAISCRISPGYGKWPLASQPALFSRLPHREIGVHLEHSLLMTPRKSVSFAMWLGADARPLAGLSGCARCELESCRYRRAPHAAEEDAAT